MSVVTFWRFLRIDQYLKVTKKVKFGTFYCQGEVCLQDNFLACVQSAFHACLEQ